MASIVVDWVELVENFTEPGFDKVFPAVLLVGNKVRNRKSLVAFSKENATVFRL